MKFYDWKMDAIKGGRGFHVDIGAFTSPITGGGNGTIIDQDRPEGIISAAAGTVIIPIRISVQVQHGLVAADNDETEILIAVDKAAAAAGATGIAGATAETPVNIHTGSSNTTACSCYSASTANWTNPTLGMELARKVKLFDIYSTGTGILLKDVDLVLMNIDTKNALTIQIKGSRAYEPSKKEIKEYGQEGIIFKTPDCEY